MSICFCDLPPSERAQLIKLINGTIVEFQDIMDHAEVIFDTSAESAISIVNHCLLDNNITELKNFIKDIVNNNCACNTCTKVPINKPKVVNKSPGPFMASQYSSVMYTQDKGLVKII